MRALAGFDQIAAVGFGGADVVGDDQVHAPDQVIRNFMFDCGVGADGRDQHFRL